jgi:hypothetical protein
MKLLFWAALAAWVPTAYALDWETKPEEDKVIVMDMVCASRYMQNKFQPLVWVFEKTALCSVVNSTYEPRFFLINQNDMLRTVDYDMGVAANQIMLKAFDEGLITVVETLCFNPSAKAVDVKKQVALWLQFTGSLQSFLEKFYRSTYKEPVPRCDGTGAAVL